MSKDALIPVEQKDIDFYGDRVIAVRLADGSVYVPVRPLCELIGVAWPAQARKLRDSDVYDEVTTSVIIRSQKSGSMGSPTAEMVALPLDYLHGWLMGINTRRVKPEIRQSLVRYQKECHRVLFEIFGQNIVTARPDEELMQSSDPAAVAYRNALSVAKIAREHYYLSQRVDEQDKRLETVESRLALIEANMGDPKAFVTQVQAQQIAEAVKAIAMLLSKRSGSNEFGRTYNQMYRQFGITSYKRMPINQFGEAMTWLRNWWVELTDNSDIPF